jgi:hypothetical protein
METLKKIDSIIYPPVVSNDSQSPEAKLMREAKAIESQAAVDTKYDAIMERFEANQQPISRPLVGFAVALSLFALASLF